MLFAIGAASSAVDLLSSLMSSKSTTQTGSSTQGNQTTGLFDLSTTTSQSSSSSTSAGSGTSTPQISPQTMSALLDAQSQTTASTGTTSTSTTPTSRSDALKDLFSLIDADGNGQITKTEFENALGAGGTNIAQADDVFSKLDKNGDAASASARCRRRCRATRAAAIITTTWRAARPMDPAPAAARADRAPIL